MSERERLFRDDAGAAVERAARLEQENAQLRGQIQALELQKNAPRVAVEAEPPSVRPMPPGRAYGFMFAALGGFLLLLGGATAFVVMRTNADVAREGPQHVPTPTVATASLPSQPMSYESALVWWGRTKATKDGGASAIDGAAARAACHPPTSMRFSTKVAVVNGLAVGVTVYATPRDANFTNCVESELMKQWWPQDPLALTTFATTF